MVVLRLVVAMSIVLAAAFSHAQEIPPGPGEVGDTRDTATRVAPDPGTKGLRNPDVYRVKRTYTTTINSVIDSRGTDVDWYSFFGCAGFVAFFDIDDGVPEPAIRDTALALFTSEGTLIGYADDQPNTAQTPPDPGSSSGFHSFLGEITLPEDGVYYLAVSAGPDGSGGILPDALGTETGRTPLVRPDGVIYGPNLFVANFGVEGAWPGVDTFSGQRECIASPRTCGNYRLYMTYEWRGSRPFHNPTCSPERPAWTGP